MRTIDALKEEVKDLNQLWTESYAKGDSAFLQRYLSDDYLSTYPDGTVLDKEGEIESVKSGEVSFTEIPRELNVRVYGEAAVITGRSTLKAKVKGQDVSGDYRLTHVWIRQSDRWQVVASQVTRVTGT